MPDQGRQACTGGPRCRRTKGRVKTMVSYPEHVIDRLNEQLSAVIDGGLAQHVGLDSGDPGEKALERRIHAVIDAARAQAIDLDGSGGSALETSLETQKLGWVLDSLVEN